MPKSKTRKEARQKKASKRRNSAQAKRNINYLVETLSVLNREEDRLIKEAQASGQEPPLEEAVDPRPCKGKNSNICVAEGCYGEACLNEIQEENKDDR